MLFKACEEVFIISVLEFQCVFVIRLIYATTHVVIWSFS